MAGGGSAAQAQASAPRNPSAPRSLVEEQRQLERERALRAQQESDPQVRLQSEPLEAGERLPAGDDDAPCFRIERLSLGGDAASEFQWLLGAVDGSLSGL